MSEELVPGAPAKLAELDKEFNDKKLPLFRGPIEEYGRIFNSNIGIPYLEKQSLLKEIDANSKIQTTIPITDEDLDAYKKKAYVKEQLNFDNWVLKNYVKDKKSIADIKAIKEIYPSFFERQREAIKEKLKLQEDYHMLKAGIVPTTPEELYKYYKFSTDTDLVNAIKSPIESKASVTQTADIDKMTMSQRERELAIITGLKTKYEVLTRGRSSKAPLTEVKEEVTEGTSSVPTS